MVMNVSDALAAYQQTSGSKGASSAPSATNISFSDTLKDFVGDAVDAVHQGEQMAAAGATGKANLQDVVVAVGEAELMMQTIVSLRDRVINAYQEVMRMSV